MNLKERLRSIPLWASVLTLIHLVLKNWMGLDIPGWADISSEVIAILAILLGTAGRTNGSETHPADRHLRKGV